ncbi:MAG: Ig-like domain-containing protein [Acidobacteriota bacterium]|nr:Ig-like domain-containing protein [Acidobacteriota bacterium]
MKNKTMIWLSVLGLFLAVGLFASCDNADVASSGGNNTDVEAGVVMGEDGSSLALDADPEKIEIDANDENTPVDPDTQKLLGTSDLTATALDPDGAPVVGAEVVFTSDAGSLASEGNPVLTDDEGKASDTLTVLEDDPEEIMVTATGNNLEITITVQKNFIPLNNPPVADAGDDQEVECGETVTLDGSGSTDADSSDGTNDDIVLFEWFLDFGLKTEEKLGEGEMLDVDLDGVGTYNITLQVTDAFGATDTDETVVEIVDTTPPEISVELSPSELWPPNHRMVSIEASVEAEDVCSDVMVMLMSVESNEPENDIGDGNTAPDIAGANIGTEDYHFQLRAERSGTGSGRTYTVVYKAVDASGNEATATAYVIVPHDQGHQTGDSGTSSVDASTINFGGALFDGN